MVDEFRSAHAMIPALASRRFMLAIEMLWSSQTTPYYAHTVVSTSQNRLTDIHRGESVEN